MNEGAANGPLPDVVSNSASLQQRFFDEGFQEVEGLRKKYSKETSLRRGIAYALKAISIFGALIVAAHLASIPQTPLGIIIAAAVGIDQLTSNHARLIIVTLARNACERLLIKIRNEHRRRLPAVTAIRDRGAHALAGKELEKMLSELNAELHAGMEAIMEGVREGDLKALKDLYIDVKKT